MCTVPLHYSSMLGYDSSMPGVVHAMAAQEILSSYLQKQGNTTASLAIAVLQDW